MGKILQMLVVSVVTGVAAGGACVLFYVLTQICDGTREAHPWLLWLLPAAGLLIVILYDGFFGEEDLSMDVLLTVCGISAGFTAMLHMQAFPVLLRFFGNCSGFCSSFS